MVGILNGILQEFCCYLLHLQYSYQKKKSELLYITKMIFRKLNRVFFNLSCQNFVRGADDSGIHEEFQIHLVFSGRNEMNCLYFCFILERIKRRCCILLPASNGTWHSMYIRTVSSYRLLSALLNWLKLVHEVYALSCLLNTTS